jgi:hypothetical protein
MAAPYDIFRKTPTSDFIWFEEVEDITQARKRLIHLASNDSAEYRLWDAIRQKFVEPSNDCE